jgi:murein DD-endopeptidase MepM/ murein hydrolase activator NlpD
MPRLRWAAIAVISLLCIGLASPAAGQTRRERDAARAKRAKLAAELNTLKASDAQIEAALRTLNGEVDAQLAKAAAARQAVAAAERKVAQATAEVRATEERIAGLRTVVVERAVDAYMRPSSDSAMQDAANPSEAARRDALLNQVLARDRDLVDQLGAALEDLELKRAAADNARQTAVNRRKAVDARAVELLKARSARQRVASDLDQRIARLTLEADAAAANEATINRVIAERDAQRNARGGYAPGAVSGSGLIWPIRGTVTSEFGARWGRQHTGIDIAAGTGTPIRAAKGGEVVFAGRMGGYGNCIIVNHGGGFSTLYAHQSRLGASDGQDVEQGEVIGYVGSTGNSTGPHLHFETRVNGTPQNPRRYLP